MGNALELRQMKEVIKWKRKEKLRAGVLLLKNYAPIHIAQVTVFNAINCGLKLQQHSPYL